MDMLSQAQKLQKELQTFSELKDIGHARDCFAALEKLHQTAKHVETQIKLIKIASQTQLCARAKNFRRQVDILLNKEPTLDDVKYLQQPDEPVREVAPGVKLPAVSVPTEDFIPDTPLYFVRSTGEWGVKILGVPITGAIGNISSTTKKHIQCPKAGCRGSPACGWHHAGEPWDWCPSNWMYCDKPSTRANQYMRHYGSRDSLVRDLRLASGREKSLRGKQVAHDLLVQLVSGRL